MGTEKRLQEKEKKMLKKIALAVMVAGVVIASGCSACNKCKKAEPTPCGCAAATPCDTCDK